MNPPEKSPILSSIPFTPSLIKELEGEVTDKFLELLLDAMSLAFKLPIDYQENIKNFKGRYLFRTADQTVAAAATFEDGEMTVHHKAIDDWDVMVTFKDAEALRDFIFSQNQDILDSILANKVEVDRNFNYIYKFGFMARDLVQRLGVQ